MAQLYSRGRIIFIGSF